MSSRRRLASLGVAFLLASGLAGAQQASNTYRVGLLDYGSADSTRLAWWARFRDRMHELGYVEGRNVSFEPRWGGGNQEQIDRLALDLAALKVEVIVAAGASAALAAKRATSTIPIVLAGGPDPIALGLVTSLAHPGGNITGITSISSELSGKLVQFARMVAPGVAQVGVLFDKTSSGNRLSLSETQTAAAKLGVSVRAVGVRRPEEFERAFKEISQSQVASLIVIPGGLFFAHRNRIAELAAHHRLATVSGSQEYVNAGSLVGYGADFPSLFSRAADYVDRIAKGAKPSNLPIEQPTKFELAVNLRTAKALGVALPPALLAQADRVVQ